MTGVRGKRKGVHTKIRECKNGFLQKNKDKKNSGDYLGRYNQKPDTVTKKGKYSKGVYRYKPETNTRELLAIEKYFDATPKKKISERLDEILKENPKIKEKKSPLLGIIYGLLNEILTTDRIMEVYPTLNLGDATDKLINMGNYSRNDGEEYITMLTRHYIKSEEEADILAQNIYK